MQVFIGLHALIFWGVMPGRYGKNRVMIWYNG